MNYFVDNSGLIILFVLILYREHQHSKTVNSLLDRLMAKTLPEFKRAQVPLKRVLPQPQAPLTDAEMAALEVKRLEAENDFSGDIADRLARIHDATSLEGAGAK